MREDSRLLRHGERLEHALDGDEAVAGLGRELLGLVEHAAKRRRHMHLRAAAGDLGQLGKRGFGPLERLLWPAAGLGDQPRRQALRIVEQHFEQMLGRDLRIAFADGEGLRRLHETLEPVGEFLEIHGTLPCSRTLTRRAGPKVKPAEKQPYKPTLNGDIARG